MNISLLLTVEKTTINENVPENGPFLYIFFGQQKTFISNGILGTCDESEERGERIVFSKTHVNG